MARQSAGKARHSLISRRLSTAERGLSSGGDTDMVRPSRGAPEGSMDPGRRMTTPAIIFPKLTKLSRLRHRGRVQLLHQLARQFERVVIDFEPGEHDSVDQQLLQL